MSLTAKPIRFGVSALIILAIMAGLVVWAWGQGGAGGGLGESASLRGMVEIIHYDANGNIKFQRSEHNATTVEFLTAAAERLSQDGVGVTDDQKFKSIRACKNAAVGTLCEGGANFDVTNLVSNPINGTQTDSDDGIIAIQVTFTGVTASTTIEYLQLTDANSVDGNKVVGAHQDVAVTLAPSDTLQVTWTITVE